MRAQVGFSDIGAGTVYALVIADSADDLARAGQIIEKGIAASGDESGLAAHLKRNTEPLRDAYTGVSPEDLRMNVVYKPE